nr:alpha-amylase family glycosyl hydrolase [uncultured Carboxylicivirga sp.]
MKFRLLFSLILVSVFISCNKTPKRTTNDFEGKAVVYQVFTRLFGNTNETNKPWGTIEENGVGKFNDFTDKALTEIKDLGVTHIWYTGVPHHAVVTDYTQYGISLDDPDVVKGRAGSPYAVKDYYQVDPDMAVDPANRLLEFKALVDRTHQHGLKVIIDIVPNHVARHYEGLNNPEGVKDFGTDDDTTVEYSTDNNFYYIPGQPFEVPEPLNGYQPLGGEQNTLIDGKFEENPAKWTGNGSRKAQPHFYDWYETVKVNYGVRPDGTNDFDTLPKEYATKGTEEHYQFWKDKKVPDSWIKFRDIALFWTDFGIDGFRFDMAEMVPVEFWSYMNSSIKHVNPDAFLLAEVYNPGLYRDYIQKGKMDYLYDKVEFYDTLKHVMQGHGLTDNIPQIQEGLSDIEHHMLHFLENHDEQRIASAEFAGDAEKGKPAMIVSSLISTSPTMIYFGQEVGEPGAEDGGFGDPSRTSIFDYIGVPHHQRWMNGGSFDGGRLLPEEKALRDFYKRLLNFTITSKALMGKYKEIHDYNRKKVEGYDTKVFSFARWSMDEQLIVISNFDAINTKTFSLQLPEDLIKEWKLTDSFYILTDQLYGKEYEMEVTEGIGLIELNLKPLESLVLKVE